MHATIPRVVHVDGVPYQFETEAEAGVSLDTGERWWGTRVQWRPGTRGRWRHSILVDVHPFALGEVESALPLVIRERGDG